METVRVGRLLIPLILCERKEDFRTAPLPERLFEKNYDEYIDKMLAVSQLGPLGKLDKFFSPGVEEACTTQLARAGSLLDLQQSYRQKIQRARSSALLGRLIDMLFEASGDQRAICCGKTWHFVQRCKKQR